MLKIKVCVDLSSADIRVSEQFLHSAQVAARLQQVSGKAVPEQMRVDPLPDTGFQCPVSDPCLDGARTDPPAPDANE